MVVASGLSSFAGPVAGGFEASCHRRADGTRLDIIAATGHLARARQDYGLLAGHGVRVARDAFRWHLIETAPGRYDWASVLPLLEAAEGAGVQVVWDLLHFGFPDAINPWHPDTPTRFAEFCHAAAELVAQGARDGARDAPPIWTPINEISFFSWAAGEHGHFAPWGQGRGSAFKQQLVRCAIAGMDACRAVDPGARFVHADPVIHVPPRAFGDGLWTPGELAAEVAAAKRKTAGMFEAWDMIAGRIMPELGGASHYLDIVGVNFYQHNQWLLDGTGIPRGAPQWRPFQDMLVELQARYGRPLWVSETGAEQPMGDDWLDYVVAEIGGARRRGADVLGCCLYPVMDYFGWDDDRHCPCGLIGLDRATLERSVRPRVRQGIAQAIAALSPDGSTSGDSTKGLSQVPRGGAITAAPSCATISRP